LWRAGLPDLRLLPRWSIQTSFFRDVANVGAAEFIGMFALQAVVAFVIVLLRRYGGAEAVGQYNAASNLGVRYFDIVLRAVSVGVATRYVSATLEGLKEEVEAGTRFVFGVVPPLILVAIAVREPVMYLLTSHEYEMAAHIVGYQMAGDFARGLSYVYATVLLFRGEVRAFLLTELSGAVMLVAFSAALIPIFGEAGATYAYALTYCGYVVVTAVVVNRACGVPLQPWRLAATILFTAVAAITVRACLEWPMLRIPLLIVGVVWGLRTELATTIWNAALRRLNRLRGQ
jgi:O-antigen/teichoic acid export membrane protein